LLDGRVIGAIDPELASTFIKKIRHLKGTKASHIPTYLETAFVPHLPHGQKGGQFPGIYIYTTAGRMMRPVKQLATGKTYPFVVNIFINLTVET